MSATAIANRVRMSPRKVGIVAALVRGRSVNDAIVILDHTPRLAAGPVKEAIKSAASNAEQNHNYKPDSLFISEINVTTSQRLKRFRPAARGRALRYQRKSSKITVIVDGEMRQIRKTTKSESDKEQK